MKFTEQKFDLMLESAWRGFESTLMLHGMSKHEVAKFVNYLDSKDGYSAVYDAVSESVKWDEI